MRNTKFIGFFALCCNFGILFSNTSDFNNRSYTEPEGERINLSAEDVSIEKGSLFVLLWEGWLPTKTIRSDTQGLYVFYEDIASYGDRVVSPPKWQCPYCFRYWKLGEKCKNDNCPTNQWPKEDS